MTTDYCGNAVYENGMLKMLLNEAGYVSFPDKKYHFYLKDHQGNTRVVADKDGNVEETNSYYPFGGAFTSANSVQPYKYNGKELDQKNGLNWYDYGARHYDAAIGRWHVVDPMMEKYYSVSPYVYCLNNPMKFVDPEGGTVLIWYKNDSGRTVSYSYSGGQVTNSNAFVKSVVTAYSYNKVNGIRAGNDGGKSSVAIVEDKSIKVNVMEREELINYSPDNAGGTIFWNPDLGLENENGTVSSPATIFDHEATHALGHKKNPEKYDIDRNKYDKRYENAEERRVIAGPEQKTAFANREIKKGEVTRTNHKGKYVKTEGVTSTKINRQKTNEYERKKKVWTSEPSK